MDIYIRPVEKAQVVRNRNVRLKDVAEVFLDGQAADEAERLVVFQIPEEKKKTYLVSALDIIRKLSRKYPGATISNVGEMDILVEYLPEPEKKRPVWTAAKVLIISLILFAGASTTIMCFHSDAQLPLIFQNVYYIFFGENREMPAMLSIPYSIGLGLGIIIFFNHFSKITLTERSPDRKSVV